MCPLCEREVYTRLLKRRVVIMGIEETTWVCQKCAAQLHFGTNKYAKLAPKKLPVIIKGRTWIRKESS